MTAILVLALIAIVLVAIALALSSGGDDRGQQAREELTRASEALADGELEAARRHLELGLERCTTPSLTAVGQNIEAAIQAAEQARHRARQAELRSRR